MKQAIKHGPDFGKEVLISNEEVVLEARPLVWPHLFKPVMSVIILSFLEWLVFYFSSRYPEFAYWNIAEWVGLGIICISLISLVLTWLKWRFTIYALNNKRVLQRKGVFGRSYLGCSLAKVQNVEVKISPLSRVFKFGTIRIATAQTQGDDIEWVDVKEPISLQRHITEGLEKFAREELHRV